MPLALHLSPRGFSALAELEHAYTGGEGDGLHHDVAASLAALGDEDPTLALSALYSNVFHQRTVYEATAYAVPYLAAVVADPGFVGGVRLELMNLLLAIGLSSTFETEDGTSAGSFGEGTGEHIRAALVLSAPHLEAAARFEPLIAEAVGPLELARADPPTKRHFEAVRQRLVAIEEEYVARGDRGERLGPPR